MKASKVHYYAKSDTGLCGQGGRTTLQEPGVTCLRCMYFIGWYVPLSKLTEHQSAERASYWGWHAA